MLPHCEVSAHFNSPNHGQNEWMCQTVVETKEEKSFCKGSCLISFVNHTIHGSNWRFSARPAFVIEASTGRKKGRANRINEGGLKKGSGGRGSPTATRGGILTTVDPLILRRKEKAAKVATMTHEEKDDRFPPICNALKLKQKFLLRCEKKHEGELPCCRCLAS